MLRLCRRGIGISYSHYLLAVLGVVFAVNAWAQGPIKRPSDERPELPSFEPPAREEERILPLIPLPKRPDTESLAAEQRVFIRVYIFLGNSVVTDGELVDVARPYLKREVSFSELADLRDRLTLAYVERGYLNSGAVIPPQKVKDGVLEIQIIEGKLTEINVETDGRLKESFIRERIRAGVPDPLNVLKLEDRLQLLQEDDRVQRIQAALIPGEKRGESRLKMDVVEADPLRVRLQADNYEPPSVGAEGGRLYLTHNNLSGYGDRLSGNYSRTEGLWSAEVYYSLPINAHDTTIELDAYRSESKVVERPLDVFDIESDFESYGVTLRHPLKHTLESRFDLYLSASYRRSDSFLLGTPASFSLGVEDGVSRVNVLRLGQDWTRRGRQQALALRSQFSFGLDFLGATSHSGDIPDSRFVSWLGQLQWARRIRPLRAQLIARAYLQLSNDPLLGMEQFAIGGHASVRGYRENILVRDNGAIASLEARIPVWRALSTQSRLDFALFYDAGRGWNEGGPSDSKTLSGAGIGLHAQLGRHLSFRIEWAESLDEVPETEEHNLQDDGVHIQVATEF